MAELATIAAGYLGHALVRLAIPRTAMARKGSVICAQMTCSALTNRGIPAISNERVFGSSVRSRRWLLSGLVRFL